MSIQIGRRYVFRNAGAGEYGREGQPCVVSEKQERLEGYGRLYLVHFDDGQHLQVCEAELHEVRDTAHEADRPAS